MKYDFIVFGGTGLQGRICSRDLLESGYSVMLAGRDKLPIKDLLKNKKASFLSVDLNNHKSIVSAISKSNASVVINCAELTFNVPVMKACLETRKSCTDLGGLQYITQEQFKLNNKFKKAGILNITGCGSTPGITNVMASYAVNLFDKIETIYLGFAWNSNIKTFIIPYSIQSIFNEFTQSPVILYNGKFIKTNRMRCQGTFDFKEIGKQTVYCIVHSEVYTFYKYFKNKGLKNVDYMAGFPDHSLLTIKTLLDLGFNSKDHVEINGTKIKPVDFATKVLKRIKIPKGYKETENIWLTIEGKKDGKTKKTEMNCIVKTLKGWESAGSNVDTGRTISVISQMLKEGKIKEKGVHSPEGVVPYKEFFRELSKRKMYIYLNNKKIN